jgi:Tol biopolymer transport system component
MSDPISDAATRHAANRHPEEAMRPAALLRSRRRLLVPVVAALAVPILATGGAPPPLGDSDLVFMALDPARNAGTVLLKTGIYGGSSSGIWSKKCLGVSSACEVDSPVYSPDGKRLAFAFRPVAEAVSHNIWIAEVNGGRPRQVTMAGATEKHPTWSPDGQHLAFERSGKIYRVDLCSESLPTTGGTLVSSNGAHPTWSEDGEWIAFQRRVNNQWEIFRIPAFGSGEVQLTSGSGDKMEPVWTKPGTMSSAANRIFFTSNASGTWQIHRMEADGTGVAKVTNATGEKRNPEIAQGGVPIFYDNGVGEVFVAVATNAKKIGDGRYPAAGMRETKGGRICPR